MNITLLLDNQSIREAEALAPHKNMYDLNKPRSLSKVASFPKPFISTLSNWVSYETTGRTVDQNKQKFLESLAI